MPLLSSPKQRQAMSWISVCCQLRAASMGGGAQKGLYHCNIFHTHNCMPQWDLTNWIKGTCCAQTSWLLSLLPKPMGSIWLHYKHEQKCLQTNKEQPDKKHELNGIQPDVINLLTSRRRAVSSFNVSTIVKLNWCSKTKGSNKHIGLIKLTAIESYCLDELLVRSC